MFERAGAWLAAATLAAASAACANIPTAGTVRVVHQSPGAAGLSAPDLSVLAQHPLPGEAPRAIVRGFLEAAADSSNDYAVARSFLSPAASRAWTPASGERIYDAADVKVVAAPSHDSVTVSAGGIAVVDASGDYRPDTAPVQVTMRV
ncbi:MAG: hypothetical protein ACYCO3_06755, partial [Mycobacteriales bacterium]